MKRRSLSLSLWAALALGGAPLWAQTRIALPAAAPRPPVAAAAAASRLDGVPLLSARQAPPALPAPPLALAVVKPDVPAFGEAPAAAPAEPLSRVVESDLAVAKDHPALARYLEMLARLRQARSAPFEDEELRQVQRELAAAAGLALLDRPEALEISPKGGHWLNRLTAGLHESKGVRLYWSPLHNHGDGITASYSARGWIMSDDLGPLLLRPSSPLFHECLHAYVDRGRHAGKFAPLKTQFHNWGYEGYPKSEGRSQGGYVRSRSFQADEILTNLHTAYDRARKITAGYGNGRDGWTSSSLELAPPEVRQLVAALDTPIFLAESVREMAASLLPGAADAAKAGLRGKALRKSFHRFDGSIPYVGEVEENEKRDFGFYLAELKDASPPLRASYFTLAKIRKDDPRNAGRFPVFFTHADYAVRADLSLASVAKMDLADPKVQDALVSAAARQVAAKLAHLLTLTESLEPAVERLKSLQARARVHVDLELVREIREASRAAFLRTAFYFIKPPKRSTKP